MMRLLARRGHTIVPVEPTNILQPLKKIPEIFFDGIVPLDNVILVGPIFLPLRYKFKFTGRFDRIVTSWLLRRVLLVQGRKEFDVTGVPQH
jgi:hypothetical protein